MGSQRNCTWILGLSGFRVMRIDGISAPAAGQLLTFARPEAGIALESRRRTGCLENARSPIRRRLPKEGAAVAPRLGTNATWDAAADGTSSPSRVQTLRHPHAGPTTGGEIGSKKCAHRLCVTS